MKEYTDRLSEILLDLCQSHERLVGIAQEMNAALVAGSVGAVRVATQHYDELAAEVANLEEQRLGVCDLLAADMTPPRAHCSLGAIIDNVDQESAARLGALRARLKAAITSLSRLNTKNAIMLDEGLRTVNKRFELMSTAQKKYTGYQNKGNMEPATVTRSIINHVV